MFVYVQRSGGAQVIVADCAGAKEAVGILLGACKDLVISVQLRISPHFVDGKRQPSLLMLAGTASLPSSGDGHEGSDSGPRIKRPRGPPVAVLLHASPTSNLLPRSALEALCRTDVSIVTWEKVGNGGNGFSVINSLQLDCGVYGLAGLGAPGKGHFPICAITKLAKEVWMKKLRKDNTSGNSLSMVGSASRGSWG